VMGKHWTVIERHGVERVAMLNKHDMTFLDTYFCHRLNFVLRWPRIIGYIFGVPALILGKLIDGLFLTTTVLPISFSLTVFKLQSGIHTLKGILRGKCLEVTIPSRTCAGYFLYPHMCPDT
jgi:hypothetical protein